MVAEKKDAVQMTARLAESLAQLAKVYDAPPPPAAASQQPGDLAEATAPATAPAKARHDTGS